MKKLVVLSIFIIFFASVIGSGWYWVRFNNQPITGPESQAPKIEKVFEVLPGKSLTTISRDLAAQGLIRDAQFFTLFGRFKNQSANLKKGEYLLSTEMAPSQILQVITSGKSIEYPIIITEGLSIFEIADLIAQRGMASRDDFLAYVKNPEVIRELLGESASPQNIFSLEGYLFPDTYRVTKYTDLKTLVSQMVRKFLTVYQEIETKNQMPGWSRHQIVTLASIVEKETGAEEERTLVSSVFHNRLRKGMMLQTDPTVIYGMAEATGKIELSITRENLRKPTRFNTYVIKGLPPGPISNPGRESILSVFHPQPSKYLFFVSHNDGTHAFSETYEMHSKAVKKYQMDPRARQGKSWRDLKQKKTKKQK